MKRFSQFVYAVGAYKVGSEMYVAGRAYWNDAYEQVSLKDRLAIYRDSDGKDGDNWAIVTGASEGIGRAYALELARCGFNVRVAARSVDKLA